MASTLKCKPGNKPCGKRCVPKSYKCKGEEVEQSSPPTKQKSQSSGLNTAQKTILAAVVLSGVAAVAAVIISSKKASAPEEIKRQKFDFANEFGKKLAEIEAELDEKYPERKQVSKAIDDAARQAGIDNGREEILKQEREKTADIDARIKKDKARRVEQQAQLDELKERRKSKWQTELQQREESIKKVYDLEVKTAQEQHYLPSHALDPVNNSSHSVGDSIIDNYDVVAHDSILADMDMTDLLEKQTAGDEKAAQIYKTLFFSGTDRLNKPGGGRLIEVKDSQTMLDINMQEEGLPPTSMQTNNFMVGNDIIIDSSAPPTPKSSKQLAINLIIQQIRGRDQLLLPKDSVFIMKSKKQYEGFLSQSGELSKEDVPYIAAMMAQAEFFYNNPEELKPVLQSSPTGLANYTYRQQMAQLERDRKAFEEEYKK